MEPILVSAAIVRHNGKILISQRKADASNEPNKWEFPGGKIEAHESPEACLTREIKEELNIEVVLKELYATHQHMYSNGIHVVLLFYLADFFRGDIQHLHVQDTRWITYEELKNFEFAEADIPVVKELMFSKP